MITKARRNRKYCKYFIPHNDNHYRGGLWTDAYCGLPNAEKGCYQEDGNFHWIGTYCCGVTCGKYKEK
jgi:hypothetical protein